MLAGVARQSFERARGVDQRAHVLLLFVALLQQRFLFQRLVERHVELVRDELGELVDIAVRVIERAPDVAHHRLGRHGAEGDDLADPVLAVAAGDVFDHAVAPLHAEVDVEVRQRHAFGIEEAFEQQLVADRVELGDAETPGHERTGARTAPGPTGTPLLLAHWMKSATIRK